MAKRYYYIRVYDDDGKPLATRCEQADGPREACKLAYGMIYDRSTDTCRYLDLGTRKPAYMSQRKINELTSNPANWHPIPPLIPRVATKNRLEKSNLSIGQSAKFIDTHEQVDGCD